MDTGKTKYPTTGKFKVTHFSKWEDEVLKELEINLNLRRNFKTVNAGFLTSFFSLTPESYVSDDLQAMLNFSETEFEDSSLLKDNPVYGSHFVFGISGPLKEKLENLFPNLFICHSGKVFLENLNPEGEKKIHLNLIEHSLEIAVTEENQLMFYNLFETKTGEDILFYTLFAVEQLGLDPNKIDMRTYGELLPITKVYQILRKYIRNITTGIKDEEFLKNFSLYNLSKCELSQVVFGDEK